jgi:hypothetical protein
LVDELVTNPVIINDRRGSKSVAVREPVLSERRLPIGDFVLIQVLIDMTGITTLLFPGIDILELVYCTW